MSLDAMATPLPITAAGVAFTGTCELRGCSLRSTLAGTITIYDNTAASGTVLVSFDVATGALGQTVVIPTGLRAAVGLYVAASAGVPSGSVWIA
jgi:hypothetical protein